MLANVLRNALTPAQRQVGLHLAEDADHTLLLLQDQPDLVKGLERVAILRAVFPQSVTIEAIQAEAQKWVE